MIFWTDFWKQRERIRFSSVGIAFRGFATLRSAAAFSSAVISLTDMALSFMLLRSSSSTILSVD